jgi:hypothetical protein
MDILYVSAGCPGCDRVMQIIDHNPRIRLYVTVKWVDRDTNALNELLTTGAKSKPALVTDIGTQFARLFVGAGQIEQVFTSRYR